MIIRVGQVLEAETSDLFPLNGKTEIHALKKELDVTKRVRAHPPSESIHPVILGHRAEEGDSQNLLTHDYDRRYQKERDRAPRVSMECRKGSV